VAAQQAQQSPGDIFFVDDLPENVAGAREIGLDAVLYTTPEQLRQQLLQRGVQL
jgi:FMN phosphatase YigB (HAD superfamily)